MNPTGTPGRRAAVLAGVLIAIAVTIHIPTLDQPLQEAHPFRQAQTAFTARTFHEDGIDLLHSKLPILGPPWEVPFELPLFQAGVAVLLDLGVGEALANRVVDLVWFVLTAWLLMLLVKRVAGARAGLVALAVFLFLPQSLLWSRTAMIEYLALFLVVLFAYAGLRWRASGPGRHGWFAIALVAGSLACAVKLPTALCWVAPFAILGFADDRRPSAGGRVAAWVLASLPLAAGLAWTAYTDSIKGASEATAFLTSSALTEWNLGNVAQRFDPVLWSYLLSSVLLLAAGLILLIFALTIRRLVRQASGRFVLWMVIASVVPPLLFFNLYVVHTYYSIATTASIAALAGLAVAGDTLTSERVARNRLRVLAVTVAALVVATIPYWSVAYTPVDSTDPGFLAADVVRRESRPDQLVAIIGLDWSPVALFVAHRRGRMIRYVEWNEVLVRRLRSDGYVIFRCDPTGTACAVVEDDGSLSEAAGASRLPGLRGRTPSPAT